MTRTLILALWFTVVGSIAATVAANAQEPCGTYYNNFGYFYSHYCLDAGCASPELCEQDACECATSGGYAEYCILPQYCGRYPGCNNCF